MMNQCLKSFRQCCTHPFQSTQLDDQYTEKRMAGGCITAKINGTRQSRQGKHSSSPVEPPAKKTKPEGSDAAANLDRPCSSAGNTHACAAILGIEMKHMVSTSAMPEV
jgi:hypothetical protein